MPLRDYVDSAPLCVIDYVAILVPVDEEGRRGGLQCHTGQVDVVAALYVHFAICHNFRLGHYVEGGGEMGTEIL